MVRLTEREQEERKALVAKYNAANRRNPKSGATKRAYLWMMKFEADMLFEGKNG